VAAGEGGYLPFVLSSCPVLNTAASVVQTAGGVSFLVVQS